MNTEALLDKFAHRPFRQMDIVVAVLLIVVFSPMFILTAFRTIAARKPLLTRYAAKDSMGRSLLLTQFGISQNPTLGLIIDLLRGQISACGVPLVTNDKPVSSTLNHCELPPGLFSLAGIHKNTGLTYYSELELVQHHITNNSPKMYLSIMAKGLLTHILYSKDGLKSANTFSLFGITINNVTMDTAVQWATSVRDHRQTKTAVFVNVNSINLSFSNSDFVHTINNADRVFADGSGVRLAARRFGVGLKDNVNGTDFLPPLCEQASRKGLSVYLLGAAPGVAEAAAKNLVEEYPDLIIAGVHHGYFDHFGEGSKDVIDQINHSSADIVLLALGSPIQEAWLHQHRPLLKARCALAVGGLFDFFSGNIPRAPVWMRELGIEWVWRLLQDPKTKWQRYILGNPYFLARVYLSRSAHYSARLGSTSSQ